MSCFTDIENKPDDWLALDPLTIQKPIPKTGCDTNLIVQNYLSEFKTDAQKQKVKDNLELYVDNILSSKSLNPIANKTVFQELNKIRGHVGFNQIEWVSDSNINNFVTAGVYDIKGERKNIDDNLPFGNAAPGHTFNARLEVLDSSISDTTNNDDKCITQKLTLSNRVAGDGDVYIRTGRGKDYNSITWETWGKLQQNIEVGEVTDVANFIDNGVYSGVYKDGNTVFTFVMVVINDYAIGVSPRRVSQFVYGLSKVNGSVFYRTRVGEGNDSIVWGEWKDINEDNINKAIKNAVNAEENRAIEAENLILDEIGVISEQYYKADKEIKAQALGYDKQMTVATDNKITIKNTTIDQSKEFSFDIEAATIYKAGVMTASDKSKLNNLANISASYDLNTYTDSGVYLIQTGSNEAKNYPIQTPANSVLRLTVINAYDGNNHVITQVLNINNIVGGEGNIYIRSQQNNEWKPWAKLQTNVEVGLIDQTKMDDLVDNGIYSGILSTTGETFVIICINNYAIAQQVGVHHISHLKYSLVVGTGEIKIEKRTRDAYGFWTDWENIGSGSTLSEATTETAGVVKLGKSNNNDWLPIGNIYGGYGSGLGLCIDSAVFKNEANGMLRLNIGSGLVSNSYGLCLEVGTFYSAAKSNGIPITMGTFYNNGELYAFTKSTDIVKNMPAIPVNPNQFKLGERGLELINSSNTSNTTKVTWDSSSNMNDYRTAGVYDIYGERTNLYDNLPIFNSNPGHSIAAKLTVVDSSLQKADGSAPTEIHLTQFLMLDNRVGPSADMYMRTYTQDNGHPNNGSGEWSAWKKFQGVEEYYLISDYYSYSFGDNNHKEFGMRNLIDNGIYSGIYFDGVSPDSSKFLETFTLIVINNYAVAAQDSRLKRTISQLKYAVDAITNQATVKQRTKTDGSDWTDWQDIGGGGSSEVDITDMVNQYGLYTLYSQSLMKDNVVYKYQQSSGELPQFDNNDEIRQFLISKGYLSGGTAITIMIKKFDSIITLDVDMCANYNLGGNYGLNHYKFITHMLDSVKVSADMTTL